jgi:hypothetical protein
VQSPSALNTTSSCGAAIAAAAVADVLAQNGSTKETIGGDQPNAEMIHDSAIAQFYPKNVEFTAHCIKPAADKGLLDSALAMAWTAIDSGQGRSPNSDFNRS